MAWDAREATVLVANALSRMGILDARGHVSHRAGEMIVTTPSMRDGGPAPAALTVADLVVTDAEGRQIEGTRSAPPDLALDREIYRARPEIEAVVVAQSRPALAFAAARRELLPLTHTESTLVLPSLPVHGDGGSIASAEAARAAAATLGDRPAMLLPGHGSVTVATSVAEAAMISYQIDLLARINGIAATVPPTGAARRVAREDSDRVTAQKAPADDFLSFFQELIDQRPPATAPPEMVAGSEAALRRRIVVACQLLYQHGLIEHLEHVSVRLPDRSGFLMTPRGHLGLLADHDIATVRMDGEWVAGHREPPPFRWFHRDLLELRTEIDAIVHTHQPYGRALTMAGHEVAPLYRAGATWVRRPAPVYEVADLMFDERHRRPAVALACSSSILHEASHGVDFLAPTVEEATVAALQYETQARIGHLASQLGTPQPLPDAVIDQLEAEEPTWLDWWRYYLSELPARPDLT